MKKCNNSKIHISSNFLLSICLLIMSDTLLLVTLHCNTSQHFATLHHTSPKYTSLHLSTLHFLSLTLHYPLIWLNPFTFPIVLFPLPSLNQTQYGHHIPKLISQNNEPLHCPKEPVTISYIYIYIYRVSQEECARLRESVLYVKLYRYNPKHLYPKLNGYGDNGHRKVWASGGPRTVRRP